ncbi:MAG: SPOR domain-containing protein [Steroidobacteraceae bacterium]
MSKLTMTMVLCAGLTLAGCGFAEYDWNKTLAANTATAYQTFLQHHPTNKHADDARGRMLALRDDQAWALAQATNTLAGYQDYLKSESGGVHAGDAQYQITALQRAAAWKEVQKDESAAALQAFLRQYPQGLESNQARARLSTLDYRVQLAVARSQSAAERRREQLQARFGTVVHDVVIMTPNSTHTVYRVTSEPMTQADASSACAQLARSHQSCRVLPTAGTPG